HGFRPLNTKLREGSERSTGMLIYSKENTRDEIRSWELWPSCLQWPQRRLRRRRLSITPATALSSIQTPPARTRDQTIPIPAIISSGTNCAARLPGAPIPARRARSPIAAATAGGTSATEGLAKRSAVGRRYH